VAVHRVNDITRGRPAKAVARTRRTTATNTSERRPGFAAAGVAAYLARLAYERRSRLQAIRAALLGGVDGVVESLRDRMPTYSRGAAWVALANRKRHIAVYFCTSQAIEALRIHHPELSCGVGCVRIRDSQYVPMYALREAFLQALDAPGRHATKRAASAAGREDSAADEVE
jgi:uncharacterized protein YdhG (YjbR/CyaY superfamily)